MLFFQYVIVILSLNIIASNPEEKEQSWRHNPPRLQTILQIHSDQNSMVLVQK